MSGANEGHDSLPREGRTFTDSFFVFPFFSTPHGLCQRSMQSKFNCFKRLLCS